MALSVRYLKLALAQAFGLASIVLGLALVHGQETPSGDKAKIPDKTPDVLSSGAIKPDAIYLRNAEGDLIFVPSQRYEDFAQYLRDRSLKDAPSLPPYAVDLLQCEIVARNGFADVDLRLTAQVANPAIPVVQIPLAISNMNLVAAPELRGGQNSFVKLASDGTYSWWIIPDSSKTYELHIKAVVKLTTQAAKTMLRLELPQVNSQVRLTVPGVGQEVQLVGTGTEVIESQNAQDATVANIRGQGGVVNIAWKAPTSTIDASSLEIDSVSRLTVTDQSRTWKGSTLLKIQSFGAAQEREFTIKLPPEYRWIPSSSGIDEANMTLQQVSPSGVPKDASGSQSTQIIVRMRSVSQTTPKELTIDWERAAIPDADFGLLLSGIEVEGVQRHEAQFELECPQDYRVTWDAMDATTLMQQSRSLTDANKITYAFRFARPPLRLLTQLRRVGPRLVIRPNYLINIEPNRIELTGLIEVVSDPNQLTGLRFSVGDWDFDRLEPFPANGAQIDVERDASGNLIPIFPSTSGAGGAGTSDTTTGLRRVFRVSAHRTWDSAAGAELALKMPSVELPASPNDRRSLELAKGFLVLTHAKNLQVEDGKSELQGLIEEQRPPTTITEMFVPSTNSKSIYYRLTNDGLAEWRGKFIRVPQQIYVTRHADIHLNDSNIEVDQRWQIQISNEPLRRLPILVDRRLINSKTPSRTAEFQVVLNGKTVPWTEIPDSSVVGLVPTGIDLSRWAMIEIVSSELMGEADLRVKGKFSLPDMDPGAEVPVSIPLAWPTLPGKPLDLDSQIRMKSNELIECFLNPRNSNVSVIPIGRPLDLSLPEGDREIECRVRKLERVLAEEVQIDQAWLQTLASSEFTRERSVIRFRTGGDRIRIEIPQSWQLSSSGVLLDGKIIEPLSSQDSASDLLEVDMTPFQAADPWHVLEIWSIAKRKPQRIQEFQANYPLIVGAGNAFPFLWQIVVPSHEHMIWSSNALGAEYRWTWDVIGLSRRSRWSQAELELRLGATRQSAPPLQTNQYLLSSFGDVGALQIHTAPRYLLWSPVCGVALICFWLWHSWRPARSGLMFLACVALLAVILTIATDLVIVLAQSLFASLIIVTLFYLTQWTVDRRVRQRSIFAPRATAIQKTASVSIEPLQPAPSTRSVAPEVSPLQEASS